LKPILKTYIVNIEARVTSVHNTSCEVMVTVEGESAADGMKFHTAQAFLTFVSLGDNGRPTPMPPLKVTTNEEKTLQKHAELRREHRMALKRALEK
jgi:acyl-CoA hydrolase